MELLERHFEIALETPDGIDKLRELILLLAMQGKLVPQDSNEQPASELLKEIKAEKKKLITEGKIKKQNPLAPIKNNEIPYEVPISWEWIKLEEICTLITDGTHLTPSYTDAGIPFLSVKNLSSGTINFDDTKFISINEHKELTKRCKPEMHDILLTKIGTTGIAVTVNTEKEFSIFVSVALLKFLNRKVNPYFLENLINSPLVKKYSKEGTEGVGNKNLVLRKIREFIIPLPPLAEQKRIVAKIDQLMVLCDKLEVGRSERNQKRLTIHTATMNRFLSTPDKTTFNTAWDFITNNFEELYSVPKNVEELKKAILQLAVMGKLVPQDPNDQPASELLKAITAEKKKLIKEGKIKKQTSLPPIKANEIPYEVPKGWEWVRLGDILSKYGAGSTPIGGQRVYKDFGIMFLRSQNIWNDGLRIDRVARIDEEIHEKMSGTKVEANDILLNITGASIGRSSIFPSDIDEANVSQHVAILRTINIAVVPYLHLFIISPCFQKAIMEKQVGVSREGLSMAKLKDFYIPLPPLAEQKRIVTKIDQLLQLCNTLERQINNLTNKQVAIFNAVLAKV